MADVAGVVRRDAEALLGNGERHAVLARYEGLRRERGEPAQIGTGAQVAGEFARIGVVGALDERGEVVEDLLAVVEQEAHVGVVARCLECGEHARRVPVLRVELDRLAQVALGEVLLAPHLLLVGEEGDAVVDDLGGAGGQMEGPVAVRMDEAGWVRLVGSHALLDERGVLEREDALAAHIFQNEAQAVLLYGVKRHGASFRCS